MVHKSIETIKQLLMSLKLRGYEKEFSETVLFNAIRGEFGVRTERIREVAKAISDLDYAHPLGNGVWVFAGEFAPKPATETDLKTDEAGNRI